MKKQAILFLAGSLVLGTATFAQEKTKAQFREPQPGYYQNTIQKGLKEAEALKEKPKYFKADYSGMNLPTNPEEYKQNWHQKPISQGVTGTCWCFSTTSFYESEIKRISGQEIKLSEMYPVYWDYVERAKYFVQNRGNMTFGEGSETNAVAKLFKKYGAVPADAYKGNPNNLPFFNHEPMVKELESYLKSVKERNAWNEDEVVATTKSILNHHMGVPPTSVTVNGKQYTPLQYVDKVLKLNMDKYVNFMSLMQVPFYETGEYKVPDNWWRSKDYNNVPATDFMAALKTAVNKGYTVSIGGDVSEAGLDGQTQVAMIPTFDIPSEYIDDNARQFRFSNGTSTDDHAMHLVGYKEVDGKTWFLVKDSGAGSRNCGESCSKFGYFFMHEDYIKLKMMTLTVNEDAVKEILQKMKKS
ncbi:MAG: C1 family peptidase [Bacteroidia bacterium]